MTTKLFGITASNKRVRYLHGGAFVKPDGPADERFCDQLATAAQCEVGSIDYPLSKPIGDVLSAISLELDKSGPCIIVGTSAGGVAASMVRHRNIRGIVMISGCATYAWAMALEGRDEKLAANFFGVDKLKSKEGKRVLRQWLPEFRTDMPPTLIIHGDKDPRFPVQYAWALRDIIGGQIIVNMNMDHGIENGFARMQEIRDFVTNHTQGA